MGRYGFPNLFRRAGGTIYRFLETCLLGLVLNISELTEKQSCHQTVSKALDELQTICMLSHKFDVCTKNHFIGSVINIGEISSHMLNIVIVHRSLYHLILRRRSLVSHLVKALS